MSKKHLPENRRPRTKVWEPLDAKVVPRLVTPDNLILGVVADDPKRGPQLGVIGVRLGKLSVPVDQVYEIHHMGRAERRDQEARNRRAWKRAGKEAKVVQQLQRSGMTHDEATVMADHGLECWLQRRTPAQVWAYRTGGKLRGRDFTR